MSTADHTNVNDGEKMKPRLQWIKYTLGLNLILCIIVGYLFFRPDTPNIGYVDSAKLLNEYRAMIDARKEFQTKSKSWQSNVDTLSLEVQSAARAYNRKSANLSNAERSQALSRLKLRQEQLLQYQRSVQQSAKEQNDKLTEEVISQINKYLQDYGRQQHYDFILVATQAGNIAYAREGTDLTNEVLIDLNKDYIKAIHP